MTQLQSDHKKEVGYIGKLKQIKKGNVRNLPQPNWTQRSNVGQAQEDQFWLAECYFTAQNLTEKHLKKQPMFRKMSGRK